eukprot:Hpha_TRINITY_DN1852_c0_g1::TRINITY_DN1852_c0_g1_i1::g.170581::m.170581/K09518/DNAJB12; DnaJ homolog subfamily B member 12
MSAAARVLAAGTDFYAVLNVAKDAPADEIKRAYRRLALELHPDKNTADGADEAFKAVGEAYSVLSDPQRRKEYDQFGPEGAPGADGFNFHGDFGDFGFDPFDLFGDFFEGTEYMRWNHGRKNHGRSRVPKGFQPHVSTMTPEERDQRRAELAAEAEIKTAQAKETKEHEQRRKQAAAAGCAADEAQMTLKRTKQEPLGLLFREELPSDGRLIFTAVDSDTPASRANTSRYFGWQLLLVDGVPVASVGEVDVLASKGGRKMTLRFRKLD